MTNVTLLQNKINASGYKLKFLAEELKITPQTLTNKINNRCDFKSSEICVLIGLLKLTPKDSMRIFFAGEVDK